MTTEEKLKDIYARRDELKRLIAEYDAEPSDEDEHISWIRAGIYLRDKRSEELAILETGLKTIEAQQGSFTIKVQELSNWIETFKKQKP